MIGLIQRVDCAHVEIDGECVGAIAHGILALIGVEKGDARPDADRLLERILGYRIFDDSNGKMNLCLREIHGGLLLVPQFTLAADTRKGTRPGFSPAAEPQLGQTLFAYLLERAQLCHTPVAAGQFGMDMQVHLVNHGPATFWLRVPPSVADSAAYIP